MPELISESEIYIDAWTDLSIVKTEENKQKLLRIIKWLAELNSKVVILNGLICQYDSFILEKTEETFKVNTIEILKNKLILDYGKIREIDTIFLAAYPIHGYCRITIPDISISQNNKIIRIPNSNSYTFKIIS